MTIKKRIPLLLFILSGLLIPGWAANEKDTGITEKNTREVIDFLPGATKAASSELKIETEFFNIDFSSAGGNITAFRHKDPENKAKSNVDIVVNDPFYFNLYKTPESEKFFKNSHFSLKKIETNYEIAVKASINARVKTNQGEFPVNIIKTYRFDKKSHYWDFFWEVENKSNVKLTIPELYFIPMNDMGPALSKNAIASSAKYLKDFYYVDGEYQSVPMEATSGGGFFCGKTEDIGKVETVKGNVEYFGMGSRFMIFSIQPVSSANALTIIVNNHKKKEMHAHLSSMSVEPNSSSKYDFIMYAGPKVNKYFATTPEEIQKNSRLKLIHKELYKAFDFGVTAPIRDIIVLILKGLYKIIPNYGVAILLFSIGLKLIFFPLNQAQVKSTKKMQELQPKIKEINERYKKNPQEKQRKTIELYKIHKVNPMAGCLPLLIQAPIFIALYTAFSDSYELWGSHFIKGWINDLSEPDTVYTFSQTLPLIGGININILPILMAGTQFLQTTFTMVTTDKNQKLMFQILPIVMVVFFWNMPSGVVLYWTLFNILSVIQQLITNKATQTSKA